MTPTEKRSGLTQRRIRELLDYDTDTGLLRWRTSHSPRARAGALAGTAIDSGGYHVIGVDRIIYRVHRIVWFWMTGTWAVEQVDHINGNRIDNRWTNLRAASWDENSRNRKQHRSNKAGYKGVRRTDALVPSWKAIITHNHKVYHLGTFRSPELAAQAYNVAAMKLFGEFARVA